MAMSHKRIIIILAALLAAAVTSVSAATVANDVPSRISKAIVSYLVEKDPSYSGKRIEVEYKYADRIFRDLKARKGSVTFAVVELYPDFKPIGNIIVPIQVSVDGELKEKLFLRTRVSVYENIVVATKRMKRGDIIGTTEAAMEVRDISTLNSQAIKDINLVLGKEAKTYIPLNNAIYEYMIKEKPVVRKNESIKISAYSEGLSVEAGGVALEDGAMGMEIRVRNSSSGKEMIAEVTGTGEVTVK